MIEGGEKMMADIQWELLNGFYLNRQGKDVKKTTLIQVVFFFLQIGCGNEPLHPVSK